VVLKFVVEVRVPPLVNVGFSQLMWHLCFVGEGEDRSRTRIDRMSTAFMGEQTKGNRKKRLAIFSMKGWSARLHPR
jgi:hypothetical protein